MADFVTTNATPGAPAAPGVIGTQWYQAPIQAFSPEMTGRPPLPTTPLAIGGKPRPTSGLVFPA